MRKLSQEIEVDTRSERQRDEGGRELKLDEDLQKTLALTLAISKICYLIAAIPRNLSRKALVERERNEATCGIEIRT